jgi:hypothetical protein
VTLTISPLCWAAMSRAAWCEAGRRGKKPTNPPDDQGNRVYVSMNTPTRHAPLTYKVVFDHDTGNFTGKCVISRGDSKQEYSSSAPRPNLPMSAGRSPASNMQSQYSAAGASQLGRPQSSSRLGTSLPPQTAFTRRSNLPCSAMTLPKSAATCA